MKLRLTQPGWETYNGQMGEVFFEDGLSTTDVSPLAAVRVSAVLQATWEDGSTSNVAEQLINKANDPAPTPEQSREAELKTAESPKQESPKPHYSQEELENIANNEGIAGLRRLAEPHGIKSNSINTLIAALLQASA